MNVPDPADDEDDEDDEDEVPEGTATVHVPASPSVAFSCVWLVSDCRVTSAVPVEYPLVLAAGRLEPRNAPAARAAPAAATTTTTTTPASTQRPRRRRSCFAAWSATARSAAVRSSAPGPGPAASRPGPAACS